MRARHLVHLLLLPLVCAFSLAQPPGRGDFPGYGILPKEDTGALRFIGQHPDYDGRGVVIAIFDTGVDPGAPGLQITTQGEPKIIDIVDGSGSGDVDTSVVREAEGGVLTGLSDRPLKLDPGWNNPTGQYHVGLKRAYELYPGGLVARLKAKRRETWDEQQRAAVTALTRQLAAWDAAHSSPTDEQTKERDELKLRIEQLEKLQSGYDDPGPIFDCVVFHDGDVHRVAIDTDEDGDLSDEKLLTNYRREHAFGTFGDEDLMNFAVNVYEDGNLLSIVADAGAHGTHVAGIVAANFPDQPELNGLAPGAQLVAVKIGDTRLGSTSAGTGEVRGCVAVLENHCDLINMSYGGATADPNGGRNAQIYSEIVNKHGVIFVSSAGNEGPSLSTVGAPGGTTSALLGVGAYISPDMMAVQYSLRERLSPRQYTWSSRGPTYDGDLGVTFSAPGGAIAPVPNWVLQRNMLMNGTSMAAPNACGNIALLLSAMKAQGVPYTPQSIRRALENTALVVPGIDLLTQGRGLVQVDKAYDYLTRFPAYHEQGLRFEVRVPGRQNARGVYLREPNEVSHPLETRFTVTPIFHDDADNRDKVDLELRCTLACPVHWVEVADHLMLMHGGRRMDLKVDPTRLAPGVHYTEVCGYDSACPERGPIFRLPITVVRSVALDEGLDTWSETIQFEAGQVERRFLVVPEGATWVDVRVRRLDDGEPRLIVLQTAQLVPGYSYKDWELEQYLSLGPEAEVVRSTSVVGGRTLELCLAQYWSSLGRSDVEVELSFHGIVPDREAIALDGSEVATRLNVRTPLRRERVGPKGTLTTLRHAVRPKKADVHPLDGRRDLLPEERQVYELVLTYEFEMTKADDVTPRVAMMNCPEYEKSWQSQMYMIFDSAKRLVATRWYEPDPVHLEKGTYTLRFHVRYDDRDQLEKLKAMVMMLDHELDSPIKLRFYTEPDGVILGTHAFSSRTLTRGEQAMVYVAGPNADKLPSAAQPGDQLLGTISFGQPDASLPGAGKRPGGFDVSYVVPPKPTAEKEAGGGDGDREDDKSEEEKIAEAIRDLKVARLAQLEDEEHSALFDRLAAEVLKDYPNHTPVLRARLHRADGADREESLAAVVAAADAVIAQVDQERLAAHYGVKLDAEDKEGAEVRKEMDKQKDALVDALHRKGKALFDMLEDKPAGERAETDAEETGDAAFEEAFAELGKWVDTTDADYLDLHIEREQRQGRLGEAVRLVSKKIEDAEPKKALYEQRIRLLDDLGWSHWKAYEEAWLLIRFPADYPRF